MSHIISDSKVAHYEREYQKETNSMLQIACLMDIYIVIDKGSYSYIYEQIDKHVRTLLHQ